MSDVAIETVPAMGTVVTVQVVGHGDTAIQRRERDEAIRRATDWFRIVEATCSRFDPRSELRALCAAPGGPVGVGELLFELLSFALEVARETDGAFDPTVGGALEARGFDQHFRTGARAPSADPDPEASWRDVVMDRRERTVTLRRRLTLDLGGLPRGLRQTSPPASSRPLATMPLMPAATRSWRDATPMASHGGLASGTPVSRAP